MILYNPTERKGPMIEAEGIIKPTKKEIKQILKERKKKLKELSKKFRTMNSCMIDPKDITVGSLEKYTYRGCTVGVLPIIGEKILIKIDSDYYFNLEEINNNKDLRDIRKSITLDEFTINEKILSCYSGEIRIVKESLHSHPYFEDSSITKPINIKKLKKYLKA